MKTRLWCPILFEGSRRGFFFFFFCFAKGGAEIKLENEMAVVAPAVLLQFQLFAWRKVMDSRCRV